MIYQIFGEWMKTNEQQFRKPHRHDGSNMHMDQHMMDGNNQMMPQNGLGPNNGQYMYQNCQNQMMPHGMGQIMVKYAKRSNASRSTKCLNKQMVMRLNHLWKKVHHNYKKSNYILLSSFLSNILENVVMKSAFMATIEAHTLCDTFVSESLSYTQ